MDIVNLFITSPRPRHRLWIFVAFLVLPMAAAKRPSSFLLFATQVQTGNENKNNVYWYCPGNLHNKAHATSYTYWLHRRITLKETTVRGEVNTCTCISYIPTLGWGPSESMVNRMPTNIVVYIVDIFTNAPHRHAKILQRFMVHRVILMLI